MSLVSIVAYRNFNQQELEVLYAFKNHIEALIRKDRYSIDAFLAPTFQLIHMTGKVQPKNEFISEVMGGLLNYYSARLVNPQIEIRNNFARMIVDVEFDAMIYGARAPWTLHSKNIFQNVNYQWYFIKWDNM